MCWISFLVCCCKDWKMCILIDKIQWTLRCIQLIFKLNKTLLSLLSSTMYLFHFTLPMSNPDFLMKWSAAPSASDDSLLWSRHLKNRFRWSIFTPNKISCFCLHISAAIFNLFYKSRFERHLQRNSLNIFLLEMLQSIDWYCNVAMPYLFISRGPAS